MEKIGESVCQVEQLSSVRGQLKDFYIQGRPLSFVGSYDKIRKIRIRRNEDEHSDIWQKQML